VNVELGIDGDTVVMFPDVTTDVTTMGSAPAGRELTMLTSTTVATLKRLMRWTTNVMRRPIA